MNGPPLLSTFLQRTFQWLAALLRRIVFLADQYSGGRLMKIRPRNGLDAALLLGTMIIGVSGSWQAYSALELSKNLEQTDRLRTIGQSVNDSFDLELNRAIEALHGAALMATSDPNLSRSEFNAYGKSLIAERPLLTSIEWHPLILGSQLAAFENDIRTNDLGAGKNFSVTQMAGSQFAPVTERTEYFPILFAIPDPGTRIGLDMSHDQIRMATKMAARDLRSPAISEIFTLPTAIDTTRTGLGFAISAPVFTIKDEAKIQAGDDSQQLRGYIEGLVHLASIFEEAAFRANSADVDLLVFDKTSDPPKLIFQGQENLSKSTDILKLLKPVANELILTNKANNRVWDIILRPHPKFYIKNQSNYSHIILFSGIFATIIITLSLFWMQRNRRLMEQTQIETLIAEQQARQALDDLRAAQAQMIHSEKMASLGQLVANVAHEINTPIGAVKASGQNIADALENTLMTLPALMQRLGPETTDLFSKLIGHLKEPAPILSSREERVIRSEVAAQLTKAGIAFANHKANILVQLRAQHKLTDYLPLLRHDESTLILDTALGIGTITNNTHNINLAVDRAANFVAALKSFSRKGISDEMVEANLSDGLETVLTIYQNQIKQRAELVRHYEPLPKIYCLPEALNQVWTNLLQNAMQAMDSFGTLAVSLYSMDDYAVVSISDSGCGIPENLIQRIFEPFFTTKAAGEGSGLGLDIAKNIIDRHKGHIKVQSTVGVGTTFSVYLPLNRPRTAET